MELKEKFEFIERVADLKSSDDSQKTQLLYIGEKPKQLAMKEKVDETFYEIKKYLKIVSKSRVELDFECSPFENIEDLNVASKDLFSLLRKCTKLMSLEGVQYLVEINLAYDLELYISAEVTNELKGVKDLQVIIPTSERLRTTPRLYGKDGKWKSFVVKCELEKFEISEEKNRERLEI